MPQIFFIIIFLLSFTHTAAATIVSYVDDQGRVKYVNTNFDKVPDQYYWQVADQLNPLETDAGNTAQYNDSLNDPLVPDVPWHNPHTIGNVIQTEQNEQPALNQSPLDTPPALVVLEIFVEKDCPDCLKLESALSGANIPFIKFDINIHPVGRLRYEELGGGTLPITRIGTKTVRGYNIPLIQRMLRNQ